MAIGILGFIFMALVPLGQIFARVVWMNGSLSLPWLLLPPFWIFPLSVIPALAAWLGFMRDGSGGQPPYDWWMLLPVVCKICLALFGSSITEDYGIFASFILLLIQLAVSSVPHIIRLVRNCPNKTMTFGYVIKSFVDGSIENGVGDIFPFLIQFVPFIGMFVSIIESLPILGDIAKEVLYAIGYIGTYVIINMLNGYDFNKQCNIRSIADLAYSDKIASIVSMVISLFMLFGS